MHYHENTMKTIDLEFIESVAILTLNRPDSLNSINLTMHEELAQALKQIQTSSARVMLLTGKGRGFCAGQDLTDRTVTAHSSPKKIDLGESLEKRYNPLIRSLQSLEIPIVCAVNGVAAGAGVSLVLASDIVLMSEKAKLTLAFSRIGLVPDSGCSWFLTQCLGTKRALALAMLSESISAEQAKVWGIAWEIYQEDNFKQGAMELCQKLATMPTKSLGYLKRCLAKASTSSLNEQLNHERDFQRLAGRTKDYQEGVTAFLEKRQPNFTGE